MTFNSSWIFTQVILIFILIRSLCKRAHLTHELSNSLSNIKQISVVHNSKGLEAYEPWERFRSKSFEEYADDTYAWVHCVGHSILIITKVADLIQDIFVFSSEKTDLCAIVLLLITHHVDVSFVML